MAKRGAGNSSAMTLSSEQCEILLKMDKIIPHDVWRHLKTKIVSMPWRDVSDACKKSLPNHVAKASALYKDLLAEIDSFITNESAFTYRKQNKLHEASAANIMSMTLNKNKIMEEYCNDPINFVHAMVRLLELTNYLELLSAPSPGPASSQTSDETMGEGCQNNEQWVSPNSSPQSSFQQVQSGQDQAMEVPGESGAAIQALEDLIQRTRNEIDQYNDCYDQIKTFAANVFPKEKSPQDKMTIEELSPDSFDHDQYAHIADMQHNVLQALILKFGEIERWLDKCLVILKKKLAEWRKSEWLRNVYIGPERLFDENLFARFAIVLNTLSAWFCPANQASLNRCADTNLLGELCTGHPLSEVKFFETKLLAVEKDFVKSCMIVTLQPPQTRTLENANKNSGNTAAPQETAGKEKKKKASEKSFGSKKQQGYNTKIRLAGGGEFSSICFTSAFITCVSEADLAQAKENGRALEAPKASLENNLRWNEAKQPEENCAEKEFSDVRISDHFRENKNRNHEEFVRICYFATLVVNGRKHTVQVLSLPFHFITGSNQLLSCLGSRLWYFGSTDDLYNGSFKVRDKLPIDEVIELLDKRIRYVDSNGRHLRKEEKDFLKDILPVENGLVSLNNFVKEATVPKRNSKHTFYVWFHAVTNTIETSFLRPWLDGAIYGLVDEEFCYKLLIEKRQNTRGLVKQAPMGTAVLRLGQMQIDKPNSQSPELALVAQIKYVETNSESGATEGVVRSISLTPDIIKLNGLYNAVRNLKDKGSKKELASYLLGYKLNKSLDFLKRYNEPKSQFDDHYKVMIEKIMHLYVSSASESQLEPDPSKKASKKARRSQTRSRQASSSTQAWSSFDDDPESPQQGGMFDREVELCLGQPQSSLQASPRSKHPHLQSQKSFEHSFVTVAQMNGGVAVKAESASSSPVPATEPNFENYNGVAIDTAALLKRIQRAKLDSSSPPKVDVTTFDMLPNASPSSGVQTMSPASDININSPKTIQTYPIFPNEGLNIAIVKKEYPSHYPESFHQIGLQGVPTISHSDETWNFIDVKNTGESFQASTAPTTSVETGRCFNLPTILSEAEPQQNLTERARRSGKGKQTTGQKCKKRKEVNQGQFESVTSQPPPPAAVQQTSYPLQASTSVGTQPLQLDAMIVTDSTMTPSETEVLVQMIEVAMSGHDDPNLGFAVMQEQFVPFDALEQGEHMAEMFDPRAPEMNRMDSGLGGESLSPTTQPPTLRWV